MEKIQLKVQSREGVGKNKANKLRREEIVPGVVYGSDIETKAIQVDRPTLEKVYRAAGETALIDLELDGDKHSVLIKELQKHPFKDEYLHVDFQKLNMKETVRVTVPINLIGRENIKDADQLTLVQQLDEIELECLPGNIPQSLDVDISSMDFDNPIFVSDLAEYKDKDITLFREGEEVICSLVLPDKEPSEEEVDELPEADEVPVIGEDDEE